MALVNLEQLTDDMFLPQNPEAKNSDAKPEKKNKSKKKEKEEMKEIEIPMASPILNDDVSPQFDDTFQECS